MKIVDVCGFYSDTGGGVKRYVLQKLAAARAHGHELVVIAPGATSHTEQRSGGRIVWVRSPPMPGDANYRMFWSAREAWAVLDAEAPDVVEGSSPWRGGWIAGAWPGNAARSLVFHQDFVAGYPYTALDRLLPRRAIDGLFAPYWRGVRRLSARFDVTVAGGEWLARRLADFGLNHPVAVPFGIETQRFSPALRDEALRRDLLAQCGFGPEGRLLLSVGRFHPEKRHHVIIEAVGTARARRPDLALAMIGDGLSRRSVERAAARVGGVTLLGAIADHALLARYYASADVLVHASAAETYGLAVAEAMASGLPVVVPDCGGAADLAPRGRSKVYPTGDAAACAEAILAILDDGGDAPTVPPPSSAEAHFSALFELYETLAARRRDGAAAS